MFHRYLTLLPWKIQNYDNPSEVSLEVGDLNLDEDFPQLSRYTNCHAYFQDHLFPSTQSPLPDILLDHCLAHHLYRGASSFFQCQQPD